MHLKSSPTGGSETGNISRDDVESDFPTNAILKWGGGSRQSVLTKKNIFILVKKLQKVRNCQTNNN
jgi:hypothetical protein